MSTDDGHRQTIRKTFLRPSDIHFTQEFINNRFEDGELIGKRLDDLVYEKKKIEEIRTIRVVKVQEKYFTPDNRRLWVFRHLQKIRENHLPLSIYVEVWNDLETEEQWLFAAKNTGCSVRIKNDLSPGGEQHENVDSIDSVSYREPFLLTLLNITSASYRGVRFLVGTTGSLLLNWIGKPVYNRLLRSGTMESPELMNVRIDE